MSHPSGLGGVPLPPPPTTGPAPGQQGYESNGNNNAHMAPPSLPPISIPQAGNGEQAAEAGLLSPTSVGGTVRRAAPEPNKRALYVGGLDLQVTEEILKQIFETTGHVQSVKIIPDKAVSDRVSRSFPFTQGMITFTLRQAFSDPLFTGQGQQLRLCRIRRSGSSGTSNAVT